VPVTSSEPHFIIVMAVFVRRNSLDISISGWQLQAYNVSIQEYSTNQGVNVTVFYLLLYLIALRTSYTFPFNPCYYILLYVTKMLFLEYCSYHAEACSNFPLNRHTFFNVGQT